MLIHTITSIVLPLNQEYCVWLTDDINLSIKKYSYGFDKRQLLICMDEKTKYNIFLSVILITKYK